MANTAYEKDETCGNFYLHSDKLGVCLLSGDEKDEEESCEKWMEDKDYSKNNL